MNSGNNSSKMKTYDIEFGDHVKLVNNLTFSNGDSSADTIGVVTQVDHGNTEQPTHEVYWSTGHHFWIHAVDLVKVAPVAESSALAALLALRIESMSPIEALTKLLELQRMARLVSDAGHAAGDAARIARITAKNDDRRNARPAPLAEKTKNVPKVREPLTADHIELLRKVANFEADDYNPFKVQPLYDLLNEYDYTDEDFAPFGPDGDEAPTVKITAKGRAFLDGYERKI